MNAVEKDKEEQVRLLEKKNKKIMDNRMRNMEEGKYMAPTDINKDPNAWKVYQQGSDEQGFLDANQTFQNNMDYESAAADNLTIGGKKRRISKKRKSIKRF